MKQTKEEKEYKYFIRTFDELLISISKTNFFELEHVSRPVDIRIYPRNKEKDVMGVVQTTFLKNGRKKCIVYFFVENFINGLLDVASIYVDKKNLDLDIEKDMKKVRNFQKYHWVYFVLHELIHVSQKNYSNGEKRTKRALEMEARRKGRYYVKKLYSSKIKDTDDCEKFSKICLDRRTTIGDFK